LVRRGHDVTVFEKRPLAGGLSTYGIIGLREPMEAALDEVRMLERLGVCIQTGVELGGAVALDDLRSRFDAVFLGVGLGATPAMGIPGEELILDGLEYIEESKLNGEAMEIGRNVVVIGAGNTAIDCATVAKRLGAASVTMVYRRSEREVSAYPHELHFIRKEGVEFRFFTQPVRVVAENGGVTGLGCVAMKPGTLEPAGDSEFVIPADQVVKAIGQEKPSLARRLGLELHRGYIQVNADFETSIPGVFAGGDCIRSKNIASTVMAVQDGKLAASAIHARLMGAGAHG
jgi:glutamate synthase (NADPH/NADH) small chain